MNAQTFAREILKPALLPLIALCLSTAGASGQTPQPDIFEMAEPALTVTEGQPAITLKVRRSSAAGSGTAAATVVVHAEGTGSTLGELLLNGVNSQPVSVPFAEGQSEASITLAATNDTLHELMEQVKVAIISVSGGGIAPDRGFTLVSIQDNDLPPFVNVFSSQPVNEGETGQLQLVLNTFSGADTRVELQFAQSANLPPATPGADFTLSTSAVVIPAGSLTGSVTVTCKADKLDEEDRESFDVVLASPVNARLGAQARAVVALSDMDAAPILRIYEPISFREGEGTWLLNMNLSHGSTRLTQSALRISLPSINLGTDGILFQGFSGQVLFAEGQTSANVPVQVMDNSIQQSTRFTRFQLFVENTALAPDPRIRPEGDLWYSRNVAVYDNDAPVPKFSIEVNKQIVAEGGTQVFRVRRDPLDLATQHTVRFVTGDGFAGEVTSEGKTVKVGEAKPGIDFKTKDQYLLFEPGVAYVDVGVKLYQDTDFERVEAFFCKLIEPSLGAEIDGSRGAAIASISNVGTIPNVTVAVADAREDEGVAVVTFTIPRSNETGSTITWSAQSGTAVADRDFGQVMGDVIYMEPGVTSYTRTVPLLQDDLSEGPETVLLNVAVSEGLTFAGGPVSFRILDDEPVPEVSLTNAMPVAEGGVLRFAVELDRISAQPVSVQVQTADGTAQAGGDYTPVNTSVTIPPGQTVGEVFVMTTDDIVDEGPQSLTLNITGAEGATIGDASGAAEITDNDDPPTLTVTVPAAVDEGTSAVVQFTLDRASERSPRIVFSTRTGTAGAPADFSTVPATVLTFGPGQTSLTQSVTVHADAEVEPQEYFDVVVSALTPDSVSYAGASRTILIDNAGGAPQPALAVEPVHAVEFSGGSLSVFFPVQLAEPATAAVMLMCRTVNGTATAGADFEGISGREIVIEPGETTGVVEVILTPDAAVEMDEEFTLEVTGTLGGQTVTANGRAYLYPAGIRHITSGNGTVVLTLPVGEGALLESTSQPDAVPWSTVPLSSEPGIKTLTLPRSTARAFYRQRENR